MTRFEGIDPLPQIASGKWYTQDMAYSIFKSKKGAPEPRVEWVVLIHIIKISKRKNILQT